MDSVKIQHRDLANGRWAELPFCLQMGNIGSEVSRALRWYQTDKPERFQGAYERALELFDLSIAAAAPHQSGRLKELCRAREEFCDYFDRNEFHTDPVKMQRYYDQFAIMGRGL